MLRIYNTQTHQKEVFKPLEEAKVRIYICGPVIYKEIQLEQVVSALVFDVIRRYLEYRGYDVRFAMSFTDLNDKIVSRSTLLEKDPCNLTESYIQEFRHILLELGILPATVYPRASHTMPQIQKLIKKLLKKGYAYKRKGHIYFRVKKVKSYGSFSGQTPKKMIKSGKNENSKHKKSPLDFPLWQVSKKGEIAWDSAWGKGRPSWHIACSAMSHYYLGGHADIHGGENNLIFPHHENKICQSLALSGKSPARYWMHTGVVQFESMGKDGEGNNKRNIKDFLAEHRHDTLRMMLLQKSYRSPLRINDEVIAQARQYVDSLIAALRPTSQKVAGLGREKKNALDEKVEKTKEVFLECMDDDFNTPKALASLYELAKKINQLSYEAGATDEDLFFAQNTLRELTRVLGLELIEKEGFGRTNQFINLLLEVRSEARAQNMWAMSDLIRDKLEKLGVTVEDGKDDSSWRWT
ncbi:MAG: cysteine--tRNA ligase [Chloroflexi bacterium]|nr:cysteine--tRNA ligase [Chloroflexota bacterium]